VNALAALILALLAFQTVRQKAYWENDLTLFLHAIDINPRSGIAHNNLGNAYWMRRDLSDSISEYRKAIAVDQSYSVPYGNLKDRLLEANDVKGAIAVMEQYMATRARKTGEDDSVVRKEIEKLQKESKSTTRSSR
jgi:tetratricopeptide (TPR) repeat protein